MLAALTQSRAALWAWAHTLKHSTKTWGTQQHQTGRFSALFWKHHNLSGLLRRNTVHKKRAFFFVFLPLFQMDGNCWGSICRTSSAARPCCLPPTTDCKCKNLAEVTAAVTCSVTCVLLHILLGYSRWQACHCLWLQVYLMIQTNEVL